MTQILRPHRAEDWIAQLFATKSARSGGIVRRKIDWVDREIGRARFEAEARRRGFHCIEAGRQLIVVCTPDPIKILF